MNISDFLSPADVLLDVRANDKGRLLRQLSAQAAAKVGLSPDEVAEQITKREELGSTGVGNGVALPHGSKDSKRRSASLLVYGTRSTLKPSTTDLSTSSSYSCSLRQPIVR